MATSIPCNATRLVWLCSVSRPSPTTLFLLLQPLYGCSDISTSTFGTSVYTPAVVHVMADFKVSRTAAIIGLSVYTLGLGFGPVISAPLSENYGRKIVYMASSPIFMLFTLGAGFSKSFASLVVCRLFAGIMGSPALAVGGGTIADLFPAHQRATVTSMFLMAPFAGPALG